MTMERKDVDEHVDEALSCPVLARRLQHVVEDIEANVPGPKTQAMMYELVDIVLQMGQRIRALEMRTVAYDVRSELTRENAHLPVRDVDLGTDFPTEDEHARHR